MNRRITLVLLSLMSLMAVPVFAQEDGVIVLNDSNPTIDVVISLPSATAGAVLLDLDQASVTVTDQIGDVVYYMADRRAHQLTLDFLADSGPHTMTLERLPGVSEARATVTAQPGMALVDTGVESTDQAVLSLSQQRFLALPVSQPGNALSIVIPPDTTAAIQATFADAPVMSQLVDNIGSTVATLYGGHVDGMSLLLDGGDYTMNLLNADITHDASASVSVVPNTITVANLLPETQADPIITASSLLPETQADPITVSDANMVDLAAQASSAAADCQISVDASSINLRSGPGTGYSVLGFGYEGADLTVGGTNVDGSWVLVGDDQIDSAWMLGQLGSLSGDCQSLPSYNIPYRSAPAAEVIYNEPAVITLPAEQIVNVVGGSDSGRSSGGGSSDDDHDDHDEHEDDDDHEDEDEGDDD